MRLPSGSVQTCAATGQRRIVGRLLTPIPYAKQLAEVVVTMPEFSKADRY
jgi:hypothetical protein